MRFQWLFVAVGAIVVFVSFLRYRRRKRRYAIEGKPVPARLFTVALLYFSTVLISVLAMGLIFPELTYRLLKFFLG